MASIAVFISTLLTVVMALVRWTSSERSTLESAESTESIESGEPLKTTFASENIPNISTDRTDRIDSIDQLDEPADRDRLPQVSPSQSNSNLNSSALEKTYELPPDSSSNQEESELTANDQELENCLNNDLSSDQKSTLNPDDFNSDSRFIPTQFLRILHRTKLSDVTLGDCTERTMAVMFADIRGFTTLSETMSPQENLHFLNAYLGRMERVIAQNQGFIDKYIGDAIMALFEGGADHAIEAAIGMLQVLREYNEERVKVGRQPIRIGIGLDIGPLILGTIGGIHRMETTAIGDAVNLASRLEELTKQYSVSVLVSHRVLASLHNPSDYSIRFIDRLHVRGRTQPVAVYEVLNADPMKLQTLKRATASLFEEGVLRFHRRQYREAAALFEECLNMNPTDRATHIYLQRSVLAGFPPSEHTWQLVKGKVIHKRRRYRGRYRAKSR
jgi:class 3 adenylate cyclase